MLTTTTDTQLIGAIRAAARPLTGAATDYDPLLDLIGDARLVLIGEASHGTHEFYQARAHITQRLIAERGFTAVAVEADWPDAYRINRYVRGGGDGATAIEALSGFDRFPLWMWRNTVVLDFVGWLREYNDHRPAGGRKAGFYGLDLYSMYDSISAVLAYLDKVDPEAAQRARHRYSCFEHFAEDSQAYGYATSLGASEPCEDEVVSQLVELQRQAGEYATRDGRVAEDEFFYAEQNARLVKNAEQYYRSMFHGRVSSWNLRDRHMAETLAALVAHLDRQGSPAKVVVWAHNSHLGDARATQMGRQGELNVGQLVRERHGPDAVLIGFSTYTGTVTAASDWDAPAERKRVRPGLPGSYEALFHETGLPAFLLPLRGDGPAVAGLRPARLERAIGVIYLPATERYSHYFEASLPDQFDAVIHLDETRALEPLDRTSGWETGEPPETYPSAL
jgi:erythromycin esterase-like protein